MPIAASASSISYNRIGGEVRRYYTFAKRFTLAMHAYLQYMPAGNETPFWSMGQIGGEHQCPVCEGNLARIRYRIALSITT